MITPAELPLNERGAVYHLDLLPEELADFVFTVGDPNRVCMISNYFDRVEIKRSHREFIVHTGYVGAKRITVLSTGIGVPNIDIVLNELDALVNIDLSTRKPHNKLKSLSIIRLGTTGSLQEEILPGEIILSQFCIGFDTLMSWYKYALSPTLEELDHQFNHHMEGEHIHFYLGEACPQLFKQFSNLGKWGITVTCGGFYAPQGRRLRIPLKYPDFLKRIASFHFKELPITNFEMESAPLYALGHTLGHRCLSLSTVLANRVTGEFVSDASKMMRNLIEKALNTV